MVLIGRDPNVAVREKIMARIITSNGAERELLAEMIRKGVSILHLTIMYRCTEKELREYVREYMPTVQNILGMCPARPEIAHLSDPYPPFNQKLG